MKNLNRIIREKTGQGDVDNRKILERAEFRTNVLEFAQTSTTAQTEFKKLITGENEKRKKGNSEVAHVSLRERKDKRVNFRKQNLKERVNKVLETSSQAHEKIKSCESIQPHKYKSFRIPVQIEATKNWEKHRVELKRGSTHANQGADVFLISSSLAKALGIVHKILPVPMRFGTADGGTTVAKTSHQYGLEWQEFEDESTYPSYLKLKMIHTLCYRTTLAVSSKCSDRYSIIFAENW
ncbi:hypothetical protein GcC1_160007 [Golovinomyces cichoracearum]|uniref:Uncharacterized protein n=1 Tax=Golovinomyces cichoracearum TaxID=62708 RepID=A0A420HUA0_9PEZI|nr:hypothetical protein GcC1_160007 [Golovinomyces cichoracearum]